MRAGAQKHRVTLVPCEFTEPACKEIKNIGELRVFVSMLAPAALAWRLCHRALFMLGGLSNIGNIGITKA